MQQFIDVLPQLQLRALNLTRNRDDADDLVQDTFLRAMRTIENARAGQVMNYLYRTMFNVFLGSRRRPGGKRGKYFYSSNTVSIEQIPGFDIEQHSRAEDVYDAEVVLEAIEQLGPRRREVMMLKAEGEMEQDIAAQLDMGRETVKTHVKEARKQLSGVLGDACVVN